MAEHRLRLIELALALEIEREGVKLVLEVDNDLLVIPTRNVKYIQVRRICTDTREEYLLPDVMAYEEVFERVPAKHGAVPNLKYEAWVTREEEST